MRKTIYDFLNKNSAVLQALAAIIVILGVVWAFFNRLPHWLSTDIVVIVDPSSDSTPREVREWTTDAANKLYQLGELVKLETKLESTSNKKNRPAGLVNPPTNFSLTVIEGTLKSPLVEPLSRRLNRGFEKLILQIENRSDRPLSRVRVNVNGVDALWSIELAGDFLTRTEITAFESKATPRSTDLSSFNQGLVLPELPTLPPNSTIQLTLFAGGTAFAEPQLSAPGATWTIRRLTKVEDRWPVSLYLHPARFSLFIFMMIVLLPPLIALLAQVYNRRIRRRVEAQIGADYLYRQACSEALENQPNEAIQLLTLAAKKGYSNGPHMLSDPDLVSLRERGDFKALVDRLTKH